MDATVILIDSDADNPRVELRIALKLVKVFVRLEESLLQNVLGVFAILGDVLSQPKNVALIALGQLVEGLGVALASLRNQSGFIENSSFAWQIPF